MTALRPSECVIYKAFVSGVLGDLSFCRVTTANVVKPVNVMFSPSFPGQICLCERTHTQWWSPAWVLNFCSHMPYTVCVPSAQAWAPEAMELLLEALPLPFAPLGSARSQPAPRGAGLVLLSSMASAGTVHMEQSSEPSDLGVVLDNASSPPRKINNLQTPTAPILSL